MNAKEELLKALKDLPKIICAEIEYEGRCFRLPVSFTEEQLSEFLERLNFDYDDFFDGPELDGTVWLEQGMWLLRVECNGNLYKWVCFKCPEIPRRLL